MDKYIFREADQGELYPILNVARTAWDQKNFKEWVEPELKDALTVRGQMYKCDMFVAEDQSSGEIVSIGGVVKTNFIDDAYQLRFAATLPKHRNQGLSTKLLDIRIEYIKELLEGRRGLIVCSSKQPERYAKMGYQVHDFVCESGYHFITKTVND